MAAFDTTRSAYVATGYVGRFSSAMAAVFGTIASWNDARVTRNALSTLTDRELDDIGLVRGDIDTVANGMPRF